MDMFKVSNTSWTRYKHVNKQIVDAMLQGIPLLGAYITTK
jgi:hypothetical protein